MYHKQVSCAFFILHHHSRPALHLSLFDDRNSIDCPGGFRFLVCLVPPTLDWPRRLGPARPSTAHGPQITVDHAGQRTDDFEGLLSGQEA